MSAMQNIFGVRTRVVGRPYKSTTASENGHGRQFVTLRHCPAYN